MLRSVDQISFLSDQNQIWTVLELNRYLRQSLESDYRLQDLWVSGEVSNASRPASGHFYFTLKDSEASLRCVMWRPEADSQPILPRDGDAIEVHGHISLYEAGGVLQLYADRIRLSGEGDLYQQFIQTRDRLEAEGLFEPDRKRLLPPWPARLGIVTSPTGAALRDVLNVLQRRFPLTEVILSPSPVQGEGAAEKLVEALAALGRQEDVDVILLVRGGGSIEDLAAFNDEPLARAIAASQIPIVSGVGHETDFTIADFAADLRAPTPSAAAELATPSRRELAGEVLYMKLELARALVGLLQERTWMLERAVARLQLSSPRAQVANARQRVDELARQAKAAVRHELELRAEIVRGLRSTLEAVGPSVVLERGYAVVTESKTGTVLRSVEQVERGYAIRVRVADGALEAEVGDVQKHEDV